MKKVFAFLSTLVLTIAFVGLFATNSVNAAEVAEGKWIEDPNLLENEDPVYIMGSIHSTYPGYYDNDAAPVENPGSYIIYPWNETRLRIAQYDEKGNPTGRYYAVYLAAGKDETYKLGAGYNILFWDVNADGKPIATRYNYGTQASGGNTYAPSLSTMRVNVSGQDLEFNLWEDYKEMTLGADDTEARFQYDRAVLVFNGKGQAIRGLGTIDAYSSGVRTATTFAAEYCYVDGVGTRIDSLSSLDECDKVQAPVLVPETDPETGEIVTDPETGEVVMVEKTDENGNVVYEDTAEPKLITSRFVWEFFEKEPQNVNENGYLGAGWDPDLWDDCYEVDGGYMCIAFVGNVGKYYSINETEELAAYTETLYQRALAENPDMTDEEKTAAKAAAETAAKADKYRECVRTLRVPEGGFTYAQGSLDNKPVVNDAINASVVSGYFYGRKAAEEEVDAEGNVTSATYMGATQTFNFTAPALTFEEKVVNNKSYRLLENQMVVEVMQGEVFTPATSINYDSVTKYWQVKNDLTSFKTSKDALDFSITESKNGGLTETVVEAPVVYQNMDEVREAFYTDLGAYVNPDNPTEGREKVVDCFTRDALSELPKDILFVGGSDSDFLDEYPQWRMLFEGWLEVLEQYSGPSTIIALATQILTDGTIGSRYNFNVWFQEFITGEGRACYANGQNGAWLQKKIDEAVPSIDAWNAYTIDTSLSAPGDSWLLTYKVENKDSGNSSEMTVKYVVVDSYTPILEVPTDAYIIDTPLDSNGMPVLEEINPYSLVKAYDAQYNGVSIKGNDITHNIKFETELDFENPVEGTFTVKATIKNNAGTKEVTKEFTVEILDKTAPLVLYRNVTIVQGEDFHCLDGIIQAYDVVDGNLKDANFKWWNDVSKSAVDTTQVNESNGVGQVTTHTISVEVVDSSKNKYSFSYKLTIIPLDATASEVKNELKDLSTAVSSLESQLDDLYALQEEEIGKIEEKLDALSALVSSNKTALDNSLNEVKESVESVSSAVANVQSSTDKLGEKGCGSGALLVLELAGAAALLALVLRKKH